MKIGCSEAPKPTYPSLLWLAEWKAPAPLSPSWYFSFKLTFFRQSNSQIITTRGHAEDSAQTTRRGRRIWIFKALTDSCLTTGTRKDLWLWWFSLVSVLRHLLIGKRSVTTRDEESAVGNSDDVFLAEEESQSFQQQVAFMKTYRISGN